MAAVEEGSGVKYKILTFGDSLTEGYHNFGNAFHPYSEKLEELLTANGYSVRVYQRGVSGERVVGGMDERLPGLLQQAEAQGIRFDWVVILGGINDIGWNVKPAKVYQGLMSLYDACHGHGARVLAMTCLETAYSRAGLPDKRSKLNEMIRGTPKEREYVEVLDLEKALPYPSDPTEDPLVALWDDGLHLTPAGYDALADIVYESLKGKLSK